MAKVDVVWLRVTVFDIIDGIELAVVVVGTVGDDEVVETVVASVLSDTGIIAIGSGAELSLTGLLLNQRR